MSDMTPSKKPILKPLVLQFQSHLYNCGQSNLCALVCQQSTLIKHVSCQNEEETCYSSFNLVPIFNSFIHAIYVYIHMSMHIISIKTVVGFYSVAGTGDFFEEWNEITHQTHVRKFEELTA